jgi:adenine-specific DNA methylase
LNVPAQNISKSVLPDESVDLVLTDPPYTDQVPYLEYSQLTFSIMGWNGLTENTLEKELVVSNAPSRAKDSEDFDKIFSLIVDRAARSMKTNGYFVMFYHTFDLTSWSHILSLMNKRGLQYRSQIPVASPRKSFKTVMSPERTLDGNYIIVFQKENDCEIAEFKGDDREAKRLAILCAQRIIKEKGPVTTQELYDCGMLKDAFEKGYLKTLAKNYSSFGEILDGDFDYSDNLWREK